jgi:hypothetical protein
VFDQTHTDREDTFASLRAAFGWVPAHDGAYAR